MEDCIFCKIVNGDIPSSKVYEDDEILAFLDISPANKGHTLVVAKDHIGMLHDVPEALSTQMMKAVQRIAPAVLKATGAKAYNVVVNNGKESGQEIAHVHIHIIPRFEDDGQSFGWTHQKYDDDEMKAYEAKIASFLK